jgi:hypothetical protein
MNEKKKCGGSWMNFIRDDVGNDVDNYSSNDFYFFSLNSLQAHGNVFLID